MGFLKRSKEIQHNFVKRTFPFNMADKEAQIFKLAIFFDNRYLDSKDTDFVQFVTSDVAHYLKAVNIDRVLLFPPVDSYYRLLIHKTVEDSFEGLCTFSIGEGDDRRTVVCLKKSITRVISQDPHIYEEDIPQAISNVRKKVGMSDVRWDHDGWEEDRQPCCRGRGKGRGRGNTLRSKNSPTVGLDNPPTTASMHSDKYYGHMYSDQCNDEQISNSHSPTQGSDNLRSRVRKPQTPLYVPKSRRQTANCDTSPSNQTYLPPTPSKDYLPPTPSKDYLPPTPSKDYLPPTPSKEYLPPTPSKEETVKVKKTGSSTKVRKPRVTAEVYVPRAKRQQMENVAKEMDHVEVEPEKVNNCSSWEEEQCLYDTGKIAEVVDSRVNDTGDCNHKSSHDSTVKDKRPRSKHKKHRSKERKSDRHRSKSREKKHKQKYVDEGQSDTVLFNDGDETSKANQEEFNNEMHSNDLESILPLQEVSENNSNLSVGSEVIENESCTVDSSMSEVTDFNHLLHDTVENTVYESVTGSHTIHELPLTNEANKQEIVPQNISDPSVQDTEKTESIEQSSEIHFGSVTSSGEVDSITADAKLQQTQEEFENTCTNGNSLIETSENDTCDVACPIDNEMVDSSRNLTQTDKTVLTPINMTLDTDKNPSILASCNTEEDLEDCEYNLVTSHEQATADISVDNSTVVDPEVEAYLTFQDEKPKTETRPDIKETEHQSERVGMEEEEEEDTWDQLFNDDGEALDPSLLDELTIAVGNVKVEKTQFNYYDYQPKEPDLDYEAYSHLIEIYDFPKELVTRDLVMAFTEFKDRGFEMKWVDDTHAIGVFSSTIAANSALTLVHPLMKVRPISVASRQTKVKAKKSTEFLQPYKPRPETVASVARNMVAGALGIQTNVPKEKRDEERRKLKEARDLKKSSRKEKQQAWDGSYGSKCAMDDY